LDAQLWAKSEMVSPELEIIVLNRNGILCVVVLKNNLKVDGVGVIIIRLSDQG
jgi:hypothetical protein